MRYKIGGRTRVATFGDNDVLLDHDLAPAILTLAEAWQKHQVELEAAEAADKRALIPAALSNDRSPPKGDPRRHRRQYPPMPHSRPWTGWNCGSALPDFCRSRFVRPVISMASTRSFE